MDKPLIHRVTLYCLAIFNPGTGTPRIYCYNDSKDLIDAFCQFKDSEYYPYTFTQTIYVTEGHPLFKFGEVVKVRDSIVQFKK